MVHFYRNAFFCFALLAASRLSGSAQLIAYDGFDYAPRFSLTGRNGGMGWLNAWANNAAPATVTEGSLSYLNLLTSGNSATDAPNELSGNGREFTTSFGQSNTTLFFSFLIRPISTVGGGQYGGFGMITFANLSIGKSGGSNNWGMENSGGGGLADSGIRVVENQTTFLVVRAQFVPGHDLFDLYVNPIPGQPLPAVPNATKNDLDLGDIRGLNMGSGSGFQFDEIRIGHTFADVAPVANPVAQITGRLTLQGAINQGQPVVFEFRPTDGSPSFQRTLTLNTDRTYSIPNVPRKSYTLWVKAAKWLAKTRAVDATSGNVTNVSLTLLAGDANNDNSVDALDLATLITAFNTEQGVDAGYDISADFNTDDSNDALDLGLLIENFNTEGEP